MKLQYLALSVAITVATLPGGLNADGNGGHLDESFGFDGVVEYQIPNCRHRDAVAAIQDDNKILVAGICDLNDEVHVLRFLPNGELDGNLQLDKTFGGGDGVTSLDFRDGGEFAQSILTQSDGKILVVLDQVIVRLNPNGLIDESFGSNGSYSYDLYQRGRFLTATVLDNDEILLATNNLDVPNDYHESGSIIRLTANGSPDSDFGTNGIINVVPHGRINDLEIDNVGNIVISGQELIGETSEHEAGIIVRLNSLGEPDQSFGNNGFLSLASEYSGNIQIQQDNQILVYTGSSRMIRVLPDGQLDLGFGQDGVIAVSDQVDFLVDRDNRVLNLFQIVVNPSDPPQESGYQSNYGITRFLSTGDIDSSFNSTGTVIFNPSSDISDIELVDLEYPLRLALQSNSKLVAIGVSRGRLVLIRLRTVSTVSTLAAVSISSGILNPVFNFSTTDYTLEVSHSTTSVSITPTLTDTSATITLNGRQITPGEILTFSSLAVGPNRQEIVVTAPDQITKTPYQIVINRATAVLPDGAPRADPLDSPVAVVPDGIPRADPLDSPVAVVPDGIPRAEPVVSPVSEQVVAPKKQMELRRNKTTTVQQLLSSIDKTAPKGIKTTVSIHKSSKKNCAVVKGKVKALRKGTCRTSIVIQPKPTKKVKKPKPIKYTVYLTIT